MLQTDETGASSVVLPDSSDDTEAAFPLTIAAQGSTRRVLRVLMWPVQPVLASGALAVAGRWERLRRPNQLAQYTGTANGWRRTGVRSAKARYCCCCTTRSQRRSRHSPTGSATRLSRRCIRRMADGAWHSRIRRWPAGIDENLNWLVTHLAQLPGPIDIVAHGPRRTAGARASRPTAGCRCAGCAWWVRLTRVRRSRTYANLSALSRRPRGHAGAHFRERGAGHARGCVVHAAYSSRWVCIAVARYRSIAAGAARRGTMRSLPDCAQQWFTVSADSPIAGGHRNRRASDDFASRPQRPGGAERGLPRRGRPSCRLAASRRLGRSPPQLFREPACARTAGEVVRVCRTPLRFQIGCTAMVATSAWRNLLPSR